MTAIRPSLVLPTNNEVLIPCLIRELCARLAPPADLRQGVRDSRPPTPQQAFDIALCPTNTIKMGIFEVPDDRRNSGQRVGSSVGVDPRLLPPPVIIERALARVAGLAQRTEVGEVVGATVTQREHVVDLSSRSRAAGPGAGIGVQTLPPVRAAIGDGHDTKTITLSCGKLTTGVTVKQWSSILMLRNLTSPETYFQAAFRVQSPWAIKNPNGDNPSEGEILKPAGFVFDFAPTRALRQMADYGAGLNPEAESPEAAVAELVSFLPVLAYDGANMKEINVGEILDVAMAGTSATLLAKKWESAILVNVDNQTLKRIMENAKVMETIMNIEGFSALGSDIFETVVNKSESVSKSKKEKGESLTPKEKRELSKEEKDYKSKRKQIQEKLIKFATRIPAFVYLTDFRENTLQDVITKLDTTLFKKVTGLSVDDFQLLVSLGVFNSVHMNQAVFAFRRYEDASLAYTGIRSHPEQQRRMGLYDTVITLQEESPAK